MCANKTSTSLEDIVALCKRRGLVFQSADIYGGLNGAYDFGHIGALIKQNIRNAWKKSIQTIDGDILFFEGTILAPHKVWEASGHVQNFNDPMVDCLVCKKRYRTDEIDLAHPCPHCGNRSWTDMRQFNMMFKTEAGALADQSSTVYLRPETAQSIFINFKNVMSSSRVKIPFGIAQIGKAFRNEITPKQFLFRMREFEQMEIEWFCTSQTAPAFFEQWITLRSDFYTHIGIQPSHIRLHEHSKDELAHYSKRCIDVEFQFPFGWKELEGIAHRGNFDLSQHSSYAGKELTVFDETTKQSYHPDVVECSVGTDRLFLALLCDAYRQETVEGETRDVLNLNPAIAPIKAAFLPLVKKLNEPMEKLYKTIKKTMNIECEFDDSGSIGKRYRRQDEIGTPVCFTYDFESINDHCVTARNRDTLAQERISIDQVQQYLNDLLKPSL